MYFYLVNENKETGNDHLESLNESIVLAFMTIAESLFPFSITLFVRKLFAHI